jgi:hypothetical protein
MEIDGRKVRWFYIRNKQNHPVGVVASCDLDETDPKGKVAFAISSLNPKDHWDTVEGKKKHHLGRDIAIARLKNTIEKPWLAQYAWKGISTATVKEQIMERIAESLNRAYAQSREAAQYWLSEEAKEKRLKKQEKELKNASPEE